MKPITAKVQNTPRPRKPTGWLGGKTRHALAATAGWGVGNVAEYAAYEGMLKAKVPKPVAWVGSDLVGLAGGLGTYFAGRGKRQLGKPPRMKRVAQTGFAGGGGRRR